MVSSVKNFFNALILQINKHAEHTNNPYQSFGIFGFIAYLGYYFILTAFNDVHYENIWLRLIAALLCALLIFKEKWPNQIKHYFPLYWYLTILYCLPFLFTFLTLKNNFSEVVTWNALSVLVLLVLLIDTTALAIILPLGVLLGWIYFKLTTSTPVTIAYTHPMLISFLSILLCGALFARRKEVIQNEKLQTMKSLSASIAHELRTPLRTIYSSINGIKEYFPQLLQGYQLAQKAKLPITEINPLHHQALTTACEDIGAEAQSALIVIDMLLANLHSSALKTISLQNTRMSDCIHEALLRYPFDITEKEMIFWDKNNDFIFSGEKTLIIHIFFNLIKNALYYIKASGKKEGKIHIWITSTPEKDCVYFEDNGIGIAPWHLHHIFDPFYSQTPHGTGIGLTFCRIAMELMHGTIICFSKPGEYTKFVLNFPKKELHNA